MAATLATSSMQPSTLDFESSPSRDSLDPVEQGLRSNQSSANVISRSRSLGSIADDASVTLEASYNVVEIPAPLVQVLPDMNALVISNEPQLLSLPTEIQLAIISYLTVPASQFLRSANRHFMTLIPPLTNISLLEAEKSDLARSNDAYACAVCLRLRRSGNFADTFRTNAFGRDRKDGKQEKRFCIDCGVKGKNSTLKYRWGDTWTRFGIPYVKCRGCLGKKRGLRERRDCPMCPSCWDRKNGRR